MFNKHAINYAIGHLEDIKRQYEEELATALAVKVRMEREPENFMWKWEDGGHYVYICEDYPEYIQMLEYSIAEFQKLIA